MFDVHVIGAGPSGCFAAISAARAGLKVLISEEHQKVGSPTNCSGLVSATGLQELSDFVDYRKCTLNNISGANIHCGGKTMEIRAASTAAYVIGRAHFDLLCAQAATDAGAQIKTGERIGGNYQSDTIIGADGPASGVARHFSFPRQPHFVSTFQGQFKYACPDPHSVEVYLSSDFPGFFGWAIPQDEATALIGAGVRPPNSSKRAYDSLVRMLGSPRELSCSGFTIPTAVRPKTAGIFGGKKVLLAGDAAGQVKATTGGGIYFGASCGRLAGQLCHSPADYEREWRRRHYPDLLIHRALRLWLDSAPRKLTEISFAAAKSLRIGQFLSAEGHMDRPSEMLGARQAAAYAKILASGLLGADIAPAPVR